MTAGTVSLEVTDGVAVVTLDNPGARNAITLAIARSLHETWEQLGRTEGIGAVVVRGAAGTFCAGVARDVIGLQRDPAADEAVARASLVYGAFARLAEVPVPVVAAVRGAAVGAGANLAMAADLRVVARDARIAGGFSRLGLHPGGGFFSLAAARMGRDAAVALGVLGEELTGERAAELGWAWRAVDDDAVEETALGLARRAAADPELARAAISSFRLEAGPPPLSWPAAVELERGRQMWTFRRLADAES